MLFMKSGEDPPVWSGKHTMVLARNKLFYHSILSPFVWSSLRIFMFMAGSVMSRCGLQSGSGINCPRFLDPVLIWVL